MLSVAEFVSTNQPAIWRALVAGYRLKPPDYYRRAAAIKRQVRPMRENWAAVMMERPKPGCGGLLPGEKGEGLYFE